MSSIFSKLCGDQTKMVWQGEVPCMQNSWLSQEFVSLSARTMFVAEEGEEGKDIYMYIQCQLYGAFVSS